MLLSVLLTLTSVLSPLSQVDTASVPSNFFDCLTNPNAAEALLPQDRAAQVPILMYHHFTLDPTENTASTAYIEDFRAQMTALAQDGWTAVSYQDLLDYVECGAPLPEKPIVITLDDGYQSNLDLALPILAENGFCATISVIGCSVGKTTYKDSGSPMFPHFSFESVAPYVEAGIFDVQTHSYDMHQVASLDGTDCRLGVLRMEGESDEDYTAAFTADYLRAKEELESALDVECRVFTYPYGFWDARTEEILQSLGVQVTVTIDPGVNLIVQGAPQSLYHLKRINVPGGMTAQELMDALAGYLN